VGVHDPLAAMVAPPLRVWVGGCTTITVTNKCNVYHCRWSTSCWRVRSCAGFESVKKRYGVMMTMTIAIEDLTRGRPVVSLTEPADVAAECVLSYGRPS